jgi:hypothetical protein
MKLRAIFPPVFKHLKKLVFNAQFALSTALSATVKVGLQDLCHLRKNFWTDATSALEGTRLKVFELFIGHPFPP